MQHHQFLSLSFSHSLSLICTRKKITTTTSAAATTTTMASLDNLAKAFNRTTHSMLCYPAVRVTSAGVWIGDNPLDFSFPLLIYQISIIFIFSRIIHFFLRRLCQPVAISQIIVSHPSTLNPSIDLHI